MTRSGWCQAAHGARPKCEACRVPGCTCWCHETRAVERDSASRKVNLQTERGPVRVNGIRPSDLPASLDWTEERSG